jgi:hypothetical protein
MVSVVPPAGAPTKILMGACDCACTQPAPKPNPSSAAATHWRRAFEMRCDINMSPFKMQSGLIQ